MIFFSLVKRKQLKRAIKNAFSEYMRVVKIPVTQGLQWMSIYCTVSNNSKSGKRRPRSNSADAVHIWVLAGSSSRRHSFSRWGSYIILIIRIASETILVGTHHIWTASEKMYLTKYIPEKIQTSLRICAVWSESSLSAWPFLVSLAIHSVPSEDSNQTARMRSLIRFLAWQACHNILFHHKVLRNK